MRISHELGILKVLGLIWKDGHTFKCTIFYVLINAVTSSLSMFTPIAICILNAITIALGMQIDNTGNIH